MATMLRHFDQYVSMGLRPIPVFKSTKCPAGGEGWNKGWSADRWRDHFKIDAAYNMGILLGDIIDVEGDTEEGNDLLLRMIDGLPHPMFISSKSIHHLFLNPDPNLTRSVFGGIEFRGNLHQSLLPPSLHPDGAVYRWLKGSHFPIPPVPPELLKFYLANRGQPKQPSQPRKERPTKRKIKDGHKKTECRICNNSFYIHKKRLVLEVRAFREFFKLPWMCHGCREFDMREHCRVMRKRMEQEAKQPYTFNS